MNYTYANRLRASLSVQAPNGAPWSQSYGYDTARRLTRVSSLAGTFDYAHQSSIFNLPSSVLLPGAVSGTWSATVPVSGSTTVPATNLTVNGVAVTPYQDNSFAVQESVTAGANTFTALAQDVHGRSSTSAVTVTVIPTNNAYSYDLNGNLLSDGTRNFGYDDENQLIAVWQANAWSNSFAYDGKLRRRIERDSYWNAGTAGWILTNEIHFVYDGNLVVQERNAANLPQVTYTRGNDLSGSLQGAGGIGGLLAQTDNTKLMAGDPLASAYYHCDGNGNVTCLVSPYQEIAAKYLYDPYGNTLAMYGTLATANTYRFSSKEWNGNSGLYYYLYRFYDPNLQRWPNHDPIQERGGINLYGYVGNNPINFYDPYGLDWSGSLGFSGTFGTSLLGPGGLGLPYGFISAGFSVGLNSSGQLSFQGYSSKLNGFGLYGGGGLSGGFAYSKCPNSTGKSESDGAHGELDLGWELIGGLSGDVDENGAGMNIPKLNLGVGGGWVSAAGPSHTVTYSTPPAVTAYPNAPDPNGYGSSRPPFSVP